eukprot:gene56483-75423_t
MTMPISLESLSLRGLHTAYREARLDPVAVAQHCLDHGGVLVRSVGDTIALSPPLVIESAHIQRIIDTLRAALRRA